MSAERSVANEDRRLAAKLDRSDRLPRTDLLCAYMRQLQDDGAPLRTVRRFFFEELESWQPLNLQGINDEGARLISRNVLHELNLLSSA